MASFHESLPLRSPTPDAWIRAVESDFDRFLTDHAACERKAAALAMSLVVKFSDRKSLIDPMVCLAREELAHFQEVYRILCQRGVSLVADEADPYVKGLMGSLRHGREEHFLDRLLLSGVIEARGCERFLKLGKHLEGSEFGSFYSRLGREEAGHYMIFVRIARNYFEPNEIEKRLDFWLDKESEVMLSMKLRPAVH